MQDSHNLPPVFAVGIGAIFVLLVLAIIGGLTSLWALGRRSRLAAFAATEGLSFHASVAPIAVPTVVHKPPKPPRSLRVHENFLFGSRRGVEIFACDFQSGEGRGSISMSMVALRGDAEHCRTGAMAAVVSERMDFPDPGICRHPVIPPQDRCSVGSSEGSSDPLNVT